MLNNNEMTVAEAARRLGRSIEQVRRYLREGRLAGRRVGQQWFIDESELLTFEAGLTKGQSMIREPAAVYEESRMRTYEDERERTLINEEFLAELDVLSERVRAEAADIDVVALIREDRDDH